ncbi:MULTISPECIES: LLM class F420-dependent oxidoreductase [Frankia]|nr:MULTISPECIES: LLM class F420-dependent oxidoreductase [Frankia]
MIPIGLVLEPPAPDVPNAVDDLVARARWAAGTGLASLWLGQGYGLDALTALALLGREIPETALGTAVTIIPGRHPIALSSQARTTQAATGGRLRLGLGSGHRASVEQRYGLPFDRPALRLREYLAALLPLLREGAADVRGETVTAVTGGVDARVAGAAPPPVLVAALGPAMLRVAGEVADGTVTWLAGARTVGEYIVPAITDAAAGRAAPEVAVGLPVCVTDHPDEVRERAAGALALFDSIPSYRAVLDREGVVTAAEVAIIGDERQVERELGRLAAAGATHLLANLQIAGAAERARTVELLGALSQPRAANPHR